MRKLLLHALVFLALWLLWQWWQDARFEHHARRVDVEVDAEGRNDWPAFEDAVDQLGGES